MNWETYQALLALMVSHAQQGNDQQVVNVLKVIIEGANGPFLSSLTPTELLAFKAMLAVANTYDNQLALLKHSR